MTFICAVSFERAVQKNKLESGREKKKKKKDTATISICSRISADNVTKPPAATVEPEISAAASASKETCQHHLLGSVQTTSPTKGDNVLLLLLSLQTLPSVGLSV